ncbi:MAG: hypothetical protein WC777_03740 [Candidatus Gracilibacteria bacterium]|jgi:hypothetical protein
MPTEFPEPKPSNLFHLPTRGAGIRALPQSTRTEEDPVGDEPIELIRSFGGGLKRAAKTPPAAPKPQEVLRLAAQLKRSVGTNRIKDDRLTTIIEAALALKKIESQPETELTPASTWDTAIKCLVTLVMEAKKLDNLKEADIANLLADLRRLLSLNTETSNTIVEQTTRLQMEEREGIQVTRFKRALKAMCINWSAGMGEDEIFNALFESYKALPTEVFWNGVDGTIQTFNGNPGDIVPFDPFFKRRLQDHLNKKKTDYDDSPPGGI